VFHPALPGPLEAYVLKHHSCARGIRFLNLELRNLACRRGKRSALRAIVAPSQSPPYPPLTGTLGERAAIALSRSNSFFDLITDRSWPHARVAERGIKDRLPGASVPFAANLPTSAAIRDATRLAGDVGPSSRAHGTTQARTFAINFLG